MRVQGLFRLLMFSFFGALVGLAQAVTPFDSYRYRGSDLPGGSDDEVLGRLPGAVLDGYEHLRFDTLGLPGGGRRVQQAGEVSGETWFRHYRLPAGMGPSAAVAVYRRNLEEQGFEILWTCRQLSVGNVMKLVRIVDGHPRGWVSGSPLRNVHCLVARGTSDGRPTTVQVYGYVALYTDRDRSDGNQAGKYPAVRLYIVREKALDARLEVVTAEEMARAIEADGKVALYGILFDHDSDRIKPESGEMLAQIVRFLKDNPGVRLFVVGHTDGTGTFRYNMDLSQRRAKAVVSDLVGRGVAADRLSAHGVGPLSPVATNATEAGRARNRRVELVRR